MHHSTGYILGSLGHDFIYHLVLNLEIQAKISR